MAARAIVDYPTMINQAEMHISFDNPKPQTYQLNDSESDSKWYYVDLANFADLFLPILEESLGAITDKFISFIKTTKNESFRSKNEYLIEPLIIGVLWNCYSQKAVQSNTIIVNSAAWLYTIRNTNKYIKTLADSLRGRLLNYLVSEKKVKVQYSFRNLQKLVSWLNASGDFKQEVYRIKNWLLFLKTLKKTEQSFILECISYNASIFKQKSLSHLGFYTQNVESFRKEVPFRNKNNENRILCERHRVEYHLNMFAAEVLNRQLKEEFDNAPNKAVLLPTCLRKNSTNCQAANDNGKITCMHCSKYCNINYIATEMDKHGVQTFLIPHSSNFSNFLKNWENNKEIGLVGVACVLNLLTGGYEMKGLNISAQCVFLDYSGCQKHWHPSGIATNLNLKQLYKTLNIES